MSFLRASSLLRFAAARSKPSFCSLSRFASSSSQPPSSTLLTPNVNSDDTMTDENHDGLNTTLPKKTMFRFSEFSTTLTTSDTQNKKLKMNNKNGMDCHHSPVFAASALAATSMVTTAAGYSMAPLLVTCLSNAPLVAFAFVQASGLSPIRQIVEKKETGDFSPFPFVSLFTNCAIWSMYGVLTGDQTILVANVAGVVCGAIFTGIFAKNTHLPMMKYYAGSGALCAFFLSAPLWTETETAIQMLGTFGCTTAIVLMASPLVVVRTVIAQKSTAAMPFPVSLAMTMNGLCWGSYGWFVAADPYIYIPNVLGFAAGLVQLSLFAMY